MSYYLSLQSLFLVETLIKQYEILRISKPLFPQLL